MKCCSSGKQYCRYVYSIGLKQNARKGESPFHIPVSDNKQTTGNKALFRHSLLFGLERKAMGKSIIRPIFGAHAKLRLLPTKTFNFPTNFLRNLRATGQKSFGSLVFKTPIK